MTAPHVPSARLRLRVMDLADPTLFSPARLADKRTLRPGPLVNHPAPEDEERIPRLWTPHLLRRAYLGIFEALLNFVWSNGGWNKFHLAYRMLIYRGHLHVERHFQYHGSLAPDCADCTCQPF